MGRNKNKNKKKKRNRRTGQTPPGKPVETKPYTIWKWIWSWNVVSAIVLCIFLAGGYTFMTSGLPWVASLFILTGAVLFLIKLFTWEFSKPKKERQLIQAIIVCCATMVLVGVALWGIYSLYRHRVLASPQEISVIHNSNKEISLKLTNNHDFAVYDVSLSICVSDKDFNLDSIKVEVGIDSIPGVPNSMLGGIQVPEIGCKANLIENINSHSTIEFPVRIIGEKYGSDFNVAFEVYDWSTSPSLITRPIDKDYVSKPPDNLGFFQEKIDLSKAIGKAYFRRIKKPRSRYFSDSKPDKYYWIGVFKKDNDAVK